MQQYSPTIRQLIDGGLFQRLPATFSVYTLDRIREWNKLFPAEQGYFERLFGLLDRSPFEAVEDLVRPMREIERKMDIGGGLWNTDDFTLEHVDFLQRSPYLAEWREAVAGVFAKVDPVLDAEVARSGNPRLVVVVSPVELPMGPDRMWTRLRDRGRLLELRLPENLPLAD